MEPNGKLPKTLREKPVFITLCSSYSGVWEPYWWDYIASCKKIHRHTGVSSAALLSREGPPLNRLNLTATTSENIFFKKYQFPSPQLLDLLVFLFDGAVCTIVCFVCKPWAGITFSWPFHPCCRQIILRVISRFGRIEWIPEKGGCFRDVPWCSVMFRDVLWCSVMGNAFAAFLLKIKIVFTVGCFQLKYSYVGESDSGLVCWNINVHFYDVW